MDLEIVKVINYDNLMNVNLFNYVVSNNYLMIFNPIDSNLEVFSLEVLTKIKSIS